MRKWVLFAIIGVFASVELADACAREGSHERWVQKIRRRPPAARVAAAPSLTVPRMLTWIVNKQAPPILEADAEVIAHEREIYKLTGWVRRARKDPHDCDVHIELSATPLSIPRVIAEIPFNQPRALQSLELLLGEPMTATYKDYDPSKPRTPIRITVVGYRFLDLSHYSTKANTGSGRKIGDGSHGSGPRARTQRREYRPTSSDTPSGTSCRYSR